MAENYEWPPDEILRAAVEEKGVPWTAAELEVGAEALRGYLTRRGLPKRRRPRKLEVSEALKKVADGAS